MDSLIVPKDLLKRKNRNIRQKLPTNIFAGNEGNVPDMVVIYYSKTINIEQIDETIRYRYKKLKEGIGVNKKELENLIRKRDTSYNRLEILQLEEKIENEERYIEDIEKDILLNKYIDETKLIIEQYRENNDIQIAEYYLLKASKYITIEKIKKLEEKFLCKGCKYDLENLKETMEGFFVCPECNSLNQTLKPNKYTKDLENYNSVYEEDINNFIKILDKFEGKNTIHIHEELYDELDDYFINRGMEKGSYYRQKPLLQNGKKENTSRKKLWSALENLGYNEYYDETSYIAHIYWGWDIPDLSLYRDQILKDYQNTQQVWARIKKDYKRSASLGTQYRLYVHLLAVGYPNCERDDFKIQDMVESLRLHNSAWERMCEECGIKYHEVSS